MTDVRRERLERLTERWRARHQERFARQARPAADAERQARATTLFPWRSESPAEYAARHGSSMVGYTYDAYTYADAKLDAWLSELGEILRRLESRG
ncbi:MAG: hypothetical protein M3P32_09520 [Chloroflexota bacterium]|nr:hypothetical protein [Chloroflexota bacterium]